MFTTCGVGLIDGEPVLDRTIPKGAYFTLTLKVKEPYRSANGVTRSYIKLSVFVPSDYITEARETFKPNQALYIRGAEIHGRKSEGGHVFHNIQANYRNIDVLRVAPIGGQKERAEENL